VFDVARQRDAIKPTKEKQMSAYKIIEVVGTSTKSWEDATAAAVGSASKSVRNLRIAEVIKLDATLDAKGKLKEYRARVALSFKYEA
jgi:flavin-binding protein dodecin